MYTRQNQSYPKGGVMSNPSLKYLEDLIEIIEYRVKLLEIVNGIRQKKPKRKGSGSKIIPMYENLTK